jgi:hypothetical protein
MYDKTANFIVGPERNNTIDDPARFGGRISYSTTCGSFLMAPGGISMI